MDLMSQRQAQSQMHLREKYMEDIRLRKLERDRRRQERIDNGLMDDPPKRVDSAGSDSSKDEGVHSNGEKAEDDINEDDLAQSGIEGVRKYAGSEVDDDEDEGMGSMAGERIKDDPDDPDEERSRPLTAISESKVVEPLIDETESALSVSEKDDDVEGSTGYSADMEGSPEPEANQPVEESETAETKPEASEPEAEATEAEPEATETEPESAEAEPEAVKAEPEAVETEAVTDDGEPEVVAAEPEAISEEPGPMEEAVTEIGNSEETRDVPTAEKPPDTSRRKRKKKLLFDLDKVTANRKPLSIRMEPLEKSSTTPENLSKKTFIHRTSVAKPVSSKKENENFKPHLKSKYELQRQNRLKYKVKLKKPSVLSNTQNESSNPDGSTDSSLAAAPPVVLTVSEVSPEEEAEKGDFVNPLMDVSMERPVAPHQRKLIDTPSGRKMLSGSSKSTEVWVPGEDQLYVYSYSSLPRLLHIKRFGGKRVATTYSNDTDPNSSFRIKNRSGRVIRGTNFGKDGAPKWNPYFAYARCLSANDYAFYETEEMRQRRDEFRERMKAKAKERREYLGVSNIFRTTNGPNNLSYSSVRKTTIFPGYSLSKNYKPPGTYPHYGHPPHLPLHADQSFPFRNFTSTRFDRHTRPPCISIGIQVFEEELAQLDSSVSAEVAVIKALVSNILREAAVEVAREAEADGAKMEELAARRLSLMGEADATKLEDAEDEVRKDPEGEETPAEETEVPPDEPEEAPPDEPEETPPDDSEAEPAEEEAQAESQEVPAEEEGDPADSDETPAKGEAQSEMEEVPAG